MLFTEARMDGFRVDTLRNMSFKDKVAYCRQMLGSPIGKGSSRMVFQLDDYTCLKLAINRKGLAQNEDEFNMCKHSFVTILPQVFNGSDEEGYKWIIAEYVLPAKEEDFMEIYGIEWEQLKEFVAATMSSNDRSSQIVRQWGNRTVDRLYSEFEDNEGVVELFNGIHEMFYDYSHGIGDLGRICNWGLVNRPTGPECVVLDSGLSQDTYNKYYSVGGNRY